MWRNGLYSQGFSCWGYGQVHAMKSFSLAAGVQEGGYVEGGCLIGLLVKQHSRAAPKDGAMKTSVWFREIPLC